MYPIPAGSGRLAAGLFLLLLLAFPLAAPAGDPGPEETITVEEYLSLGRGLLGEGKAAEAVEVLRRAAEQYPEDQVVPYFLAGAYWQAGDPDLSLQSTLRRKELQAAADLQRLIAERGDSLATTAEEVIDLHIEAIGGREALAAVKTLVVKFTAHSTGGNLATIRRLHKRPFHFRQEVVGNPRFVATNGETIWRATENDWREINEQAYRRMGSIDGDFIGYEERGVRYGFVGVEIFNNTPVYHLERIYWDDFRQDLFFSIDSGFLTEVRSEYPEGNPVMISVMSLWDYREVGGIRVPHVFIRNVGPLGPPHGGVVQEVRINDPLDDALFVKPQE